jgi:hypothetical protein
MIGLIYRWAARYIRNRHTESALQEHLHRKAVACVLNYPPTVLLLNAPHAHRWRTLACAVCACGAYPDSPSATIDSSFAAVNAIYAYS